jgi:hypothetical protein
VIDAISLPLALGKNLVSVSSGLRQYAAKYRLLTAISPISSVAASLRRLAARISMLLVE